MELPRKENPLMQTGKIQQMSRYRGFGFIRSDTGGNVFFHHTDVTGMTFELLKEGQRVKFNVGLSPRGFHARDVEPINN
jgi:CspA family cold shock protein